MSEAVFNYPAITPAGPQRSPPPAASTHDESAPGVAGFSAPNGIYLFVWVAAAVATFALPWLLANGLFAG